MNQNHDPVMPQPWPAPLTNEFRTPVFDVELVAIANMQEILDKMYQAQIERVLGYLASRYKANPQGEQK